MNVWEYLGLKENHRKQDKTVQLVKNYDEIDPSRIKPPYYVQHKEDGVYALAVVREGKAAIFGRTGKELTNVEHLEHLLEDVCFRKGYTDVVLSAELVCHECSLEQLSGVVNPNRKAELTEEQDAWVDKFQLYFHDYIELDSFISGDFDMPYYKRLGAVEELIHWVDKEPFFVPRTKVVQSLAEAEEFARIAIGHGKEGAVIKSAHEGWKSGRKNHVATKIVRGVDYDLEVIGTLEGKGKRANMVANLLVRWKLNGSPEGLEMELKTDGRFDDATRIDWFNNPDKIIGKIVHVHALQISSKGALRLPKVRAVRIDKTVADL